MRPAALVLAALASVAALGLAGCGTKRAASTTSTATATTTVATTAATATAPAQRVAGAVYLLRDGKVAPVVRELEPPAVATSAVDALAQGPTDAERADGLATAWPQGARLRLSLADGTMTVDGADAFSRPALAQLVYTLTRFPSVRGVAIGGDSYTRASFEDETPAILVESPLPGETVSSPLRLRGTANTFEATFVAEVEDAAGKRLARQVVTATSGSGERGTYDASVPYAGSGAGALVVYEVSAEDGRRVHESRIRLTLG